ncbi:MAG: DUF4493 domain-containing protein [Bacteroidales bacterium]|nr:DUF4493 domain-containing protein [Bacteroidales bacterium]
MMNYNNILKVASTLSLAVLFSCAEIEDPQSEAVGYLAAPALEVDITVQDIAQTKTSAPIVDGPSESDIRFVVKDKDGNVKYDGVGLWTEAIVLPVGAYTVDASYGSNGFGAAYFTGTAAGTIEPLDNEIPALKVSLANSLICIELDSDFAQHFFVGSSKVLLNTDSATAEVEYGQWHYIPSGADLEVTMAGTTAGELVSLTHKLSSPSPKVAYNLVCKKSSTSWPSITWPSTSLADGAFEGALYFTPAVVSNMSDANAASLTYQVKGGSYADWTDVSTSDINSYKFISGLSNDVKYSLRACVGNIVSEELPFTPVTFQSCFSVGSVTAAHNNADDMNVELSSTTMTANEMKVNLPATVDEMASVTATGSFSSSNNAATGSFESVELSSTAKNVSFTNAAGWPYLPQGDYSATVTAICSLNGSTYTASSTQTATVPAPVLDLTLSSYTSYDKYAATNNITKDLNGTTGANNCDPSTLYNAGGKWNVSSSLMSNGNYAKELIVKIDNDESRKFKVTNEYEDNKYYESISGLTWASHNLTVSFTFDGVTVNKSQTHHITGLPYTLTHPAQDWAIVENGAITYTYFGDSYIFLTSDSSTGSVKTPDFYILGETNISVSTTFKRIRDGILTNWTFSIHTYDSSGNTSEIASDTGNGKNTIHTIGGNAIFNTSCYNILCRRYYWAGSGPDAQITDFTIKYSE